MFLVFDTETTGIPKRVKNKYPNPRESKYYDGARLVEISWCIYNGSKCVVKRSVLVKYDDPIPNSHIHGITNEMTKDGIEFKRIAKVFANDLRTVDTIVAHNIMFDVFVLIAELHRIGAHSVCDLLWSKQKKDTMRMGCEFLKNNRRYIKLKVLYDTLCPKNTKQLFTDANPGHRALTDVEACAMCYFKICSDVD